MTKKRLNFSLWEELGVIIGEVLKNKKWTAEKKFRDILKAESWKK